MIDFQAINRTAEANKAAHHDRAAQRTRAHFARRPDLCEQIDPERRASSRWWMDRAFWDDDAHAEYAEFTRFDGMPHSGKSFTRPTEKAALRRVQRGSLTLMVSGEEFVDVLNEVLADLRAERAARIRMAPLARLHIERGLKVNYVAIGEKAKDNRAQRLTPVVVKVA